MNSKHGKPILSDAGGCSASSTLVLVTWLPLPTAFAQRHTDTSSSSEPKERVTDLTPCHVFLLLSSTTSSRMPGVDRLFDGHTARFVQGVCPVVCLSLKTPNTSLAGKGLSCFTAVFLVAYLIDTCWLNTLTWNAGIPFPKIPCHVSPGCNYQRKGFLQCEGFYGKRGEVLLKVSEEQEGSPMPSRGGWA